MFSDKCCLAGSVFSCGLLCSFQPFSTFLSVCLMYSSPHEHLPLHITREGWFFFYFCCYPFNCNSIMVIGKCLEFLNKIFASIFVFFTIRYFDQNKQFTLFKKIRWNNKQVVTIRSEELMHDTVNKFWWVISISKFAFYYIDLHLKVTGYYF